MAGRFSGVKLRGRDDGRGAAVLQAVVLLVAWSTSVIWPGSASRSVAAPWIDQLAVADDLSADQRRKLGKSGLHVADSFPG